MRCPTASARTCSTSATPPPTAPVDVYVANYRAERDRRVRARRDLPVQVRHDRDRPTVSSSTPYGVATGFDPVLGVELLYVADAQNNRVQMFRAGRHVRRQVRHDRLAPASRARSTPSAGFHRPPTASGDVWVADLWGWRIERWARTATGWQYAQTIGSGMPPTTDDGGLPRAPRARRRLRQGVVTVMDSIHHQLVRMNQNGTIVEPLRDPWIGQRAVQLAPRSRLSTRQPATCGPPTPSSTASRSCDPTAPSSPSAGSAGTGPTSVHLAAVLSRSANQTAPRGSPTPRTTGWSCGTWPRRTVIGQYGTGNPGNRTRHAQPTHGDRRRRGLRPHLRRRHDQ